MFKMERKIDILRFIYFFIYLFIIIIIIIIYYLDFLLFEFFII